MVELSRRAVLTTAAAAVPLAFAPPPGSPTLGDPAYQLTQDGQFVFPADNAHGSVC
jgi:hypothetical protein